MDFYFDEFPAFRENDDPLIPLDLVDVPVGPIVHPPEPSRIEQILLQRLDRFLAEHFPHATPIDLGPQIRCAVEAFPGGDIQGPLSPEMDNKLNMTVSVLVLIYVLGNTRDVLFKYTNAIVTKKKVRGIMLVARHFNVDKRSLGRSLKWALGCPSSGSSSKETFLFRNNHINYAQAMQKLLYFGNQA
eukprot:INCI10474.2.p1 GENE.INCI10474.2~~INCI10474.2.p1  ORF type:complete len:187 (+),score=16.41 INCI10474.2:154-714(+)